MGLIVAFYMSKYRIETKWLLRLLILNSLRWLNVKAGMALLKDGKTGELIEKGLKISQRLIELAEIKPGQRVLDVATGIGEPSITAQKL